MKRTLMALFLAIAITAILYYIVQATKPEPIIIEVEQEEEVEEVVVLPRVLLDISEGNRAVALEMDRLNGVSGFVLPGTYIDIYGVKADEENATDDNPLGVEVELYFTDMRVISIDTVQYDEEITESVARVGSVVVLDVSPEIIEQIFYLQADGWTFKYVLIPEAENVEEGE